MQVLRSEVLVAFVGLVWALAGRVLAAGVGGSALGVALDLGPEADRLPPTRPRRPEAGAGRGKKQRPPRAFLPY